MPSSRYRGGNLYLAGSVGQLEPEYGRSGFNVKQGDTVVSLIDSEGNLKMLGYLVVDGIPFDLKQYEDEDLYFPG